MYRWMPSSSSRDQTGKGIVEKHSEKPLRADASEVLFLTGGDAVALIDTSGGVRQNRVVRLSPRARSRPGATHPPVSQR